MNTRVGRHGRAMGATGETECPTVDRWWFVLKKRLERRTCVDRLTYIVHHDRRENAQLGTSGRPFTAILMHVRDEAHPTIDRTHDA